MRIGIYAGSFDPFTLGHMNILEGALKVFDHVIVAVGKNSKKTGLFPIDQRLELIRQHDPYLFTPRHMSAEAFDGLLSDFCRHILNTLTSTRVLPDSVSIVRGLRAVSDLESEMAIADANRHLDPRFQTVFIPARADLAYVSSSIARELAQHMADRDDSALNSYVSPVVKKALLEKFRVHP